MDPQFADPTVGLSVRGAWPGSVALRSGWSRVLARPWNDDLPDAAVRIERGSAEFLETCVRWLFEAGAPSAISVPLQTGNRELWDRAGFTEYRRLRLMERALAGKLPDSDHTVRPAQATEWPEVARLDRECFAPDWRIGRLGLTDALAATPRSRLLVVAEEAMVGFAVVGVSGSTGYLQRIAVDPGRQHEGVGRSLLRQSMRWARRRGARAMLLNTQTDNQRAAQLYLSDGFEILGQQLVVLRATPGNQFPGRQDPDTQVIAPG